MDYRVGGGERWCGGGELVGGVGGGDTGRGEEGADGGRPYASACVQLFSNFVSISNPEKAVVTVIRILYSGRDVEARLRKYTKME